MSHFFHLFITLLTPKVKLGGLEISDTAIRFVRLNKDNRVAEQVVLRLPPGIVAEGKIKNAAALSEALAAFKQKIEPKRRPVDVVLSLSSANVYTQTFFLPDAASANLNEAAQLNIQMSSPIRMDQAYAGWQLLKRKEGLGHQDEVEILSAIINRRIADDYASLLKDNGFAVMAVDFTALSFARILGHFETNVDSKQPYIAIIVSPDGIEFIIAREGELYFDFFHSWASIRGNIAKLTVPYVNQIITTEVIRLRNFYQTRNDVDIRNVLIMAPGLYEQFAAALAQNNAQLVPLQLDCAPLHDVPLFWYGAVGAAIRADMPRYRDKEISLTSIDTQEEYGLIRANAFARLWRNLLWTGATVALAAYVAALVFLIKYESDLTLSLRDRFTIPVDTAALTRLQESAKEFNRLASFTASLQDSVINWVPLLDRLRSLTESAIQFTQITVNETGQSSIAGTAPTKDAAFAFRDALKRECGVSDVDLPFRDILTAPEGAVKFTIRFFIKDREAFLDCNQ